MEVLAAAAELVRAFGSHDKSAYFTCFAPEATFIFHNHPATLQSRGEYEQLWDEWERRDAFRVLDCRSSNQGVAMFGTMALFTHDVRSRTISSGGESTSNERETIVFARRDGRWLAVHEHLSAAPPSD